VKRPPLVVICLWLLVPVAARANFGGYEAGNASTGNVQPLAEVEDTFRPAGLEQVEMQSELLQITLHIESADVEVNYTLHNPGDKAVKVTAGFPTASQDMGIPSPSDPQGAEQARRDPHDVTDYHLYVDGREVSWKLEAQPHTKADRPNTYSGIGGAFSEPEPHWFVSTIAFKPGEAHAVRIRYQALYRSAEGSVSDDAQVEAVTLTYQLSTAAGWKGPIGKGRVIIAADTVDADAIKIRPEGRFKREGRAFVWEFSDLKPTLADDIRVQVREGYETYPTDYAVARDRPEGVKKENAGEYEVHPDGTSYWIHQLFHATATSTLDPKLYGPENVQGSSSYPQNTWAEGVPGDGVGEGLDLTLERPMRLHEIGIVNGFHKSRELYQANNRVAELSVSLNGEKDFMVTIPDEYLTREIYWFPLNGYEKPVKTVRLRINKVYPGTKYQDTCISQLFLKTKLAKKPKLGPVR
jgi:hypothetical protein